MRERQTEKETKTGRQRRELRRENGRIKHGRIRAITKSNNYHTEKHATTTKQRGTDKRATYPNRREFRLLLLRHAVGQEGGAVDGKGVDHRHPTDKQSINVNSRSANTKKQKETKNVKQPMRSRRRRTEQFRDTETASEYTSR